MKSRHDTKTWVVVWSGNGYVSTSDFGPKTGEFGEAIPLVDAETFDNARAIVICLSSLAGNDHGFPKPMNVAEMRKQVQALRGVQKSFAKMQTEADAFTCGDGAFGKHDKSCPFLSGWEKLKVAK